MFIKYLLDPRYYVELVQRDPSQSPKSPHMREEEQINKDKIFKFYYFKK